MSPAPARLAQKAAPAREAAIERAAPIASRKPSEVTVPEALRRETVRAGTPTTASVAPITRGRYRVEPDFAVERTCRVPAATTHGCALYR
jgi:hypothetical protein